MARAYSLDLREGVVAMVAAGSSCRVAAATERGDERGSLVPVRRRPLFRWRPRVREVCPLIGELAATDGDGYSFFCCRETAGLSIEGEGAKPATDSDLKTATRSDGSRPPNPI